MRKVIVIISMCLFITIAVMAYQFAQLWRVEQRLGNAIEFISLLEPDLLKPAAAEYTILQEDMDIISDLWQRKELIPFAGAQSGTPKYTHIVTMQKFDAYKGYVVIEAEDGPVGVDMLLYYRKAESGSIKWELIAYSALSSEEWIINKQ